MYPFYYPFATPFAYPHFPPYGYEINNIGQFYNIAQEIHQQAQQKNEQINTNYSVNDIKLQQKEVPKPTVIPPKQKDFSNAKETVLKTQHKFQKPEQLVIKPNQTHFSKDQSQRLRYVNKNYESNIINKIFAFLWSQDKSKIYVNEILKDRTKILLYFDYIKVIRKYCKRYINKEYLQNLCNFQPQHIAYRIVARNTEKLKYFSMKELSLTIRKLIYIYLKDVCAISILTSKKMRNDIWRDHLSKSRNIFQFLFQGLTPEEYDQRMSRNYNQIYPKYGEAQKE